MSYTTDVKKELSELEVRAEHCMQAENSALLRPFAGVPFNYSSLRKNCCKKAFLRGAFLGFGSLQHPDFGYNLELICPTEEDADGILKLLAGFGLTARKSRKKNKPLVYLKDGEQVADFLRIVGADQSLLNLENIRIVRDVRNQINRSVNCEAANLHKTVSASVTQTRDIEKIKKKDLWNTLPDSLKEIATLRRKYPNASLEELGEKCRPKVGKSGVNHRFRRIHELASKE